MACIGKMAFCAGACLALAPLWANAEGKRPVVVELYTSQGCSSCPPADGLMNELAEADGVVALALHVDYWDYIGWKDTFASPAHTARQKAYARAAGEKMVYTPQMIINGTERIVGVDAAGLAALLKAADAGADDSGPSLTLTRTGGRVAIHADPAPGVVPGSIVQIVSYVPRIAVQIDRGENAGRTITYSNVVTRWQNAGSWDGARPLDLVVEASADMGVAVLLQAPGPGPVLAAVAQDH